LIQAHLVDHGVGELAGSGDQDALEIAARSAHPGDRRVDRGAPEDDEDHVDQVEHHEHEARVLRHVLRAV